MDISVTARPGGNGFRVSMNVDLDAAVARLRALVEAGDPEIIEDQHSLSECVPFVVRLSESRGLMNCERCRVPVVDAPEMAVEAGHERWARAIWEPETGRKHTLRRCEAMQGKGRQ